MTVGSQVSGLLTPAEVAQLFRVDPKTVTRWAKGGRISCIRTLGGHRRYRVEEVRELLQRDLQQRRPPESAEALPGGGAVDLEGDDEP